MHARRAFEDRVGELALAGVAVHDDDVAESAHAHGARHSGASADTILVELRVTSGGSVALGSLSHWVTLSGTGASEGAELALRGPLADVNAALAGAGA